MNVGQLSDLLNGLDRSLPVIYAEHKEHRNGIRYRTSLKVRHVIERPGVGVALCGKVHEHERREVKLPTIDREKEKAAERSLERNLAKAREKYLTLDFETYMTCPAAYSLDIRDEFIVSCPQHWNRMLRSGTWPGGPHPSNIPRTPAVKESIPEYRVPDFSTYMHSDDPEITRINALADSLGQDRKVFRDCLHRVRYTRAFRPAYMRPELGMGYGRGRYHKEFVVPPPSAFKQRFSNAYEELEKQFGNSTYRSALADFIFTSGYPDAVYSEYGVRRFFIDDIPTDEIVADSLKHKRELHEEISARFPIYWNMHTGRITEKEAREALAAWRKSRPDISTVWNAKDYVEHYENKLREDETLVNLNAAIAANEFERGIRKDINMHRKNFMPGEVIEIKDIEVRRQSAKAILVYNGKTEVWIPRSQIEDYSPAPGDIKSIFIPEWIALEKGLI